MAKDPDYNRYAGIVSLPGDPLNPKKRPPLRIDEDGNVILMDDMLRMGEKPRELHHAGSSERIAAGGLPGRQSTSPMLPAMFVDLSDEPESPNWEVRDRNGNIVNVPTVR